MQLRLKNFRRFHKFGSAHIAPITVLLGENSSGKTSFCAGFRYMIDAMSGKGEGSFNREPFFLGAFDQIAHYRGGRFGRSSDFSISLSIDQKELEELTKRVPYRSHEKIETHIELSLSFENDQSQPILSRVELHNKFLNIDMSRNSLPEFRIKLPNESKFSTVNTNSESVIFKTPNNLTDRNSLVSFWGNLQNYAYVTRRNASEHNDEKSIDLARARAIDSGTLGAFLLPDDAIYASAPFRTRPERTYSPVEASSSAEGAHTPILLAQAKAFDKEKWNVIKESIEEFGVRSKMFKKLDIKRLGRNQSDPFQIIITVSKDHSNIIDVGYGVSQILPLLAETLMNDQALFFIFQQPEVHLHPKAQAELGSYFVDFVSRSKKYVMLETHSDFMIDRIRTDLQRRGLDPSLYLSVLFFERSDFETKIHQIRYDELGNVQGAPLGYRDFFVNEAARTLGIDDEVDH